ncbi:MAG: carboxypeptidase M32 [Sphaerochaetaceae bacterium]
MTKEKAFARLEAIDRQMVMLQHINAVLSWDQELYATALESEERGRQIGYIATEIHRLSCSTEMGDLLAIMDASDAAPSGCGKDAFERALVRLHYKTYTKEKALSEEFVQRFSAITTEGYMVWSKARKENDFAQFSPLLTEIVSLTKEKAIAYNKGSEKNLYDALLDNYENGITSAEVTALFDQIKPTLEHLVENLKDQRVDDNFLRLPYDQNKQEEFAKLVITDMGFDFSRGSRAISLHPFTSTLGNDDIRITTRYTDPSVMDSFYSSIHECGHALYEQGASFQRQKGTSIANGASYAMHESQSRLWENIIGKSEAFWKHYYPVFKKIFPSQTQDISLDQFLKAVNHVEPSYIRTNSDEVSYSLHIILRYELEKKLVEGGLSVQDIPQAWNEESKKLLGLAIPNDQMGCLQDVHWASGDIGYFPTYALGNLYGAQIWDKLNQSMDSEALLEQGKLGVLASWLNEQCYSKGMLYEPKELLQQITGKTLDASYYARYLENKYTCLYGGKNV